MNCRSRKMKKAFPHNEKPHKGCRVRSARLRIEDLRPGTLVPGRKFSVWQVMRNPDVINTMAPGRRRRLRPHNMCVCLKKRQLRCAHVTGSRRRGGHLGAVSISEN